MGIVAYAYEEHGAGSSGPGWPFPQVSHPVWCGRETADCSATADGLGAHHSKPIVIRRDEVTRTELSLDQPLPPPGRILILVERYRGTAEEPDEVLGLTLSEAHKVVDGILDLLSRVVPS